MCFVDYLGLPIECIVAFLSPLTANEFCVAYIFNSMFLYCGCFGGVNKLIPEHVSLL